ncbi:MAG: hypothetical protein JST59_00310 [Actinobacteria bacterium]|nr:hypothetical protein [Actinomycetota bacterium]
MELLDHAVRLRFLFFDEAPHHLVLEGHHILVGLAVLQQQLPLRHFSGQVVWVHLNTRLYRLRYEVLSFLLQVLRSEEKRNHAFRVVLGRCRTLGVHAGQVEELATHRIDGFEILLQFCHFVMQDRQFAAVAASQPVQRLIVLELRELFNAVLVVSDFLAGLVECFHLASDGVPAIDEPAADQFIQVQIASLVAFLQLADSVHLRVMRPVHSAILAAGLLAEFAEQNVLLFMELADSAFQLHVRLIDGRLRLQKERRLEEGDVHLGLVKVGLGLVVLFDLCL